MSDIDNQLSTMVEGIQQLMNGINSQNEQIGVINKAVGKLNGRVDEMATEQANIISRLTGLEDDQFVDLNKADNIKQAAKDRAAALLGIEWDERGGVTAESMYDYSFYYPRFVVRLHADARHAGLEGPRIYATPRKSYQKLIDFINEWYPRRGVDGLKSYYDDLAAANGKRGA